MKKVLSDLATWLLVACAVMLTALVVRRELFSARSATAIRVPNWRELASVGHVIGAPHARVRIVEFSDFQCPYCAQIQSELHAILERYPSEVALVFRHFPLQGLHPSATAAAEASECAAAQGKFIAYKDALFAGQSAIGVKTWEAFAKDAGVGNLSAFRSCIRERTYASVVQRDLTAAERSGIRGTPTLVVEGRGLMGGPAELEAHVAHAVKQARSER